MMYQKPGQSDLLTGQNRKEVDVNRHFQASWASQPMGCLLWIFCHYSVSVDIVHSYHI